MKHNVTLYGNQLVAGFLIRFFWSSIFVIVSGLVPILYINYIKLQTGIAGELSNYVKLILGGSQNAMEMANSLQFLIALGIFFGVGVSYIKSKVTFIRDFAIYETMLAVSRNVDGIERPGFLFRFINSKSYRIAEALFALASILTFVYLTGLAVLHLLIPPNVNKLQLLEGNHNNWSLVWEVSDRTRCVDVHFGNSEDNGWTLIGTSCIENEWFDPHLSELGMLLSGHYDLFDQINYNEINPREVSFRVKPYGIFFAGEPTIFNSEDSN